MERIIKVVFMGKIYLKKANLIGYKNFSKSINVGLQKNMIIIFSLNEEVKL